MYVYIYIYIYIYELLVKTTIGNYPGVWPSGAIG